MSLQHQKSACGDLRTKELIKCSEISILLFSTTSH
uniref:Uncharacterized protein n=1 Tax=Arundo donax TaxID=35708 RepID=A0A0A8Z0Z5_ARUDO